MFSALRQSNSIYILDKGETPSLKVGQVVNVSAPSPSFGQFNTFTVDVTAIVDGHQMQFQKLPSAGSIATSNGLVVAETKEAMLSEVEGFMKNSQQILGNIPYHQKVVQACNEMMGTLNPQFAEQQTQKKEIAEMKTQILDISKNLAELLGHFKKENTI